MIATEATIRSKAYDRAIMRRRNLARLLLRATPLLVPMIEEGRGNDDPLVELALQQYLQSMMAQDRRAGPGLHALSDPQIGHRQGRRAAGSAD